MLTTAPRAICFDLLTALLDSWSLWNACAGSEEDGRRWRAAYLRLTYGAGDYVPYESLVHASADASGIPHTAAAALVDRWDTLAPWPDVGLVLARLPAKLPLGVVTNCSAGLGRRAVARVEAVAGRAMDVVITAEDAGAYKPDPRPYRAALEALGLVAPEVLFVAGSPSDLGGATAVGMPVVWHNAIGLERPAEQPAPRAEGATLAATLQAVGVGDGVGLRRATVEDRDALVALSRETFRDTYRHNHPESQLRAYLDAELTASTWGALLEDPGITTMVVTTPAGRAIAYTVWRAAPPPAGTALAARAPCELARIYVHRDAQGTGLGAALVRDAVARTRAAGGDALWLGVAQDNHAAIAFYERMGLARIGVTTFDFAGLPEPDFVMGVLV